MLVLNYIPRCGERGWWTPVGWTHQLVQVQDSLLVREGGGGRGPSRGRILGRNWDKSLKSFPSCYSQLQLLTVTAPHPPSSKSGLKLVCNVKTLYRIWKPHVWDFSSLCRPETSTKLYVHENGFRKGLIDTPTLHIYGTVDCRISHRLKDLTQT
jgi:hypothetical protein